jgi:hypothetical protein
MYSQKLVGKMALSVMILAIVFVLGSSVALSQPDQNKHRADLTLYFTDADLDGWHDPGEVWSAVPAGNDNNGDMSCWMASASNMLVFGGHANPYNGWLGAGGAPSPSVSSWGNSYTAPGGGAFRTFDDGGWQHWAITHVGVGYQGPIFTTVEFGAGTWAIDPIVWSQARIAEEHAVGVTVWWGKPAPGLMPGRVDLTLPYGYHAITIYEINSAAGTVTLTDSDDGFAGTRVCNYTYAGNDWIIQNLYTGVNVHVNYAVALGATGAPSLTQWGLITLLIIMAGIATWVVLKKRRVVTA